MNKSLITDQGTLQELRACDFSTVKTRVWSWVCVKSWDSTWRASEVWFYDIPLPRPQASHMKSLNLFIFSNVTMQMSIPNTSRLMRKGQVYIWWYMIRVVSGTWLILSISICGKKKRNPFGFTQMFSHTSKYKHVGLLSFLTFWQILENSTWNPETGESLGFLCW